MAFVPPNEICTSEYRDQLYANTVPGYGFQAINVKSFNCKGNGVADDGANLQSAANYCQTNNYTLFIPDGLYLTSIPLQINCDVWCGRNAVIKATASMAWVVSVGAVSTVVKHKSWYGGVIASNRLATDGFFIRNCQHYEMSHVVSTDALVCQFHVGDAGASGITFEVHADNLRSDYANDWWDQGLASGVIANSYGFRFENCTDSRLSNSEFIQSQYGCRTKNSSMIFTNVHNYAHSGSFMHYCFWDEAISNDYFGCHADTPSDKGFYFSSTTASPNLFAPRFTMNSVAITTAIGMYFNGLNNPAANIVGALFGDASSTGVWAKDMDSTGTLDTSNMFLTGTRYSPVGCVTTKNMNTNVYPVTG